MQEAAAKEGKAEPEKAKDQGVDAQQNMEQPQQQTPKRRRAPDMTKAPHNERVEGLKDVRPGASAEPSETVEDLVLAGAEVSREARPTPGVELLSPGDDVEKEVGNASGEGRA